DVLDSTLGISPLSFNGATMRGFHWVSAPSSRFHGLEVFAGQARPSLSLFDMNQGRVLGIIVPVAQGERWRVRAGMFAVSPGSERHLGNGGSGGTIWHLDGRYALTKQIAAEGEVAYAEGGLSWRARLDVQNSRLSATGEVSRLDRRSPLISIGVQPGG